MAPELLLAACSSEWQVFIRRLISLRHEQGLVALSCFESVRWREGIVPVAPLALQLSVTERRGLSERAAKIHAYMASHC